MVLCTELSIPESSNVTLSPSWNLLAFSETYEISVAESADTICPTALLTLPITFSPIIAFTSNPKPLTNVSLSNTGVSLPKDSSTL